MRHAVTALVLACLAVCPAAAQEVPPEEAPGQIVVTGNRDIERQAQDFVAALSPSRPGGQLGRFEDEVCPAAVGLSDRHKASVERRLRVVAQAAGIPVGKQGCAPNAIVMLTHDKRGLLDALRRNHTDNFGGLTAREIRQLVRSPGPAAAWQLRYHKTARGTVIEEGDINRTTESASRMTTAARPVFEASALVIEKRALEGLTTTQLADYAAMRLFARTSPERLAGSTAPTIVKILDAPMGSEVPITMTEWDLGFLRSLYAIPSNMRAGAQRDAIGRGIARDLERPEGRAEPRN